MKALFQSFAPIALGLLLITLIGIGLVTVYDAGHSAGFASAKAEGEAAIAKQTAAYESDRARAADTAANELKAAAQNLLAEQARGNQLAAQLSDKNIELRAMTEKLTGEIQRVTTLYRRSLGAQAEPLPPAAFTAGFVRVWNSALFGTTGPIAMPAPITSASGADAETGGPRDVDDLIVNTTRADLLTNHVRNGERWATCRAQLNALIDWNTNHGRN